MKKMFLSVALVALAVAGSVQTAQALPLITGAIAIGGPANPLGAATWGGATGIDFGVVDVAVNMGTQSGSYMGTGNTPVVFTDFTFSPVFVPANPLWTFTLGLTTYSFDLTSVAVVFQDDNVLVVSGQGIASITGFEDTPGRWDFSGQSTGAAFNFSSSAAAIPEPAAMSLLGLGLLGIATAARRRRS